MLRVFVGAGLAPALPGNAPTGKDYLKTKKGNRKGLPLHSDNDYPKRRATVRDRPYIIINNPD